MDKYLELIQQQEKLLASLETRIARKEEELTRLYTMLETEENRTDDNKQKQTGIKENIDLLDKYDGKNILLQNIKDSCIALKNDFKTSSLFDKIFDFIFFSFVSGCTLYTMVISPLIPVLIVSLVLSFIAFMCFLPERLQLKGLRKSTSIEIEEKKLESLEEELNLIKDSSKEIKSKIEETKKDLKALDIKKSKLTIDIDTVKKLREQIIERKLKSELNKAFVAEPTVQDILKRTRKEGK